MPNVVACPATGDVIVRIGHRRGVDLSPADAKRFAWRIIAVADQMMPVWEDRHGLTCPHGKPPLSCPEPGCQTEQTSQEVGNDG